MIALIGHLIDKPYRKRKAKKSAELEHPSSKLGVETVYDPSEELFSSPSHQERRDVVHDSPRVQLSPAGDIASPMSPRSHPAEIELQGRWVWVPDISPVGQAVPAESAHMWTRPAKMPQQVNEMPDNNIAAELASATAEESKSFEHQLGPMMELDGMPIARSEEQEEDREEGDDKPTDCEKAQENVNCAEVPQRAIPGPLRIQ